jgi:hypothetical protein
MVKPDPKQLEEIVKSQLPGQRIRETRPTDAPRRAPAEAASPEMKKLLEKYGAANVAEGEDALDDVLSGLDVDPHAVDDAVVPVEAEAAPDPYGRGSGAKAKVVSADKGKIIGSQG